MKTWIKTKYDGYINLDRVDHIKVVGIDIYAFIGNAMILIAEQADVETADEALDKLMKEALDDDSIIDGKDYDCDE